MRERSSTGWTDAALESALRLVRAEFLRGPGEVAPFASSHEAIAKIREEYLELEDEIFRKKDRAADWPARRAEACQIAAVALKFMIEFRPEDEP